MYKHSKRLKLRLQAAGLLVAALLALTGCSGSSVVAAEAKVGETQPSVATSAISSSEATTEGTPVATTTVGATTAAATPAATANAATTKAVTKAPATTAKPKTPNASTTVHLLAAGDNLIHSSLYKQAQKYAAAAGVDGYDFSYLYKAVEDIIPAADISVLNQETPIAGAAFPPSTYPMFNSPVEVGKHMMDIGFDVFNHANNHILDKGSKGVLATLDFWSQYPNIAVVGAYRNVADRDKIRTMTKNDVTFSFLGFTYGTNGLSLPEGSELQIIYNEQEDLIQQQIESAKAQSDVVVVSIHWGTEDSHTVTDAQRTLAHKMVGWGADVILGTHPHVIQPIEFVQRESTGYKALVIYSLGNFISAQSAADNLVGGLLDFDITKTYGADGVNSSISVSRVSFMPLVTQYEAGYSNIRVLPFSSYTQELANAHGVRSMDGRFTYGYVQKVISNNIAPEYLTAIADKLQ